MVSQSLRSSRHSCLSSLRAAVAAAGHSTAGHARSGLGHSAHQACAFWKSCGIMEGSRGTTVLYRNLRRERAVSPSTPRPPGAHPLMMVYLTVIRQPARGSEPPALLRQCAPPTEPFEAEGQTLGHVEDHAVAGEAAVRVRRAMPGGALAHAPAAGLGEVGGVHSPRARAGRGEHLCRHLEGRRGTRRAGHGCARVSHRPRLHPAALLQELGLLRLALLRASAHRARASVSFPALPHSRAPPRTATVATVVTARV